MIKRIGPLLAALVLLVLLVGEPTTAQTPGNVVLIVTDDQDTAGLPVMRHLMSYPRGSWVNFTAAYANDSICCPARSTLLTGQYSHHHRVISNAARHTKLFNPSNTLATWLDGAGYETALIGKYLNKITDRQPGWDVWQAGKGTVDTHTAKAVEFIAAAEEPFFLYLAYMAPHMPATPPDRYKDAAVYVPPDNPAYLEQDVSDKPAWVRALPIPGASTRAMWREERADAQRELLAIDDGVLAVVEALEAKGILDETLIIYLGDQGFCWGDHRIFYKHNAYECASRFPLLIRYPGAINHDEGRIVTNVSLAGTIADWAGVTPGLPQDAPSLTPLLTGAAVTWDEVVLLQKRAASPTGSNFRGVRVPGWTYSELDTGERELYDMAADPYQLENVAGRPEYAAIEAVMATWLAGMLAEGGL